MVDDGEIELSNSEFFPNSILDEVVKHTKICTHTHTCNRPGQSAAHTHTCYHSHTDTQVSSSEGAVKTRFNISSLKPKSSLGNRVAVKKYREKKKAHIAFLEEEVRKLRDVNQHLVRKLQVQPALKAEISSLRTLLVGIKGNIDVKLECFPSQNHCSANSGISFEEGKAIGLPCPVENPCFEHRLSNDVGVSDQPVFPWQGGCVIVDSNGASDRPIEGVEGLSCGKKPGQ